MWLCSFSGLQVIYLPLHCYAGFTINTATFSPANTGLLDPSTSDGRVIFFLPWEGMTVAGTTDAPTSVTFSPSPSTVDIEFILQEIRRYLSDDVPGNSKRIF